VYDFFSPERPKPCDNFRRTKKPMQRCMVLLCVTFMDQQADFLTFAVRPKYHARYASHRPPMQFSSKTTTFYSNNQPAPAHDSHRSVIVTMPRSINPKSVNNTATIMPLLPHKRTTGMYFTLTVGIILCGKNSNFHPILSKHFPT
jgi:hypothetical protein